MAGRVLTAPGRRAITLSGPLVRQGLDLDGTPCGFSCWAEDREGRPVLDDPVRLSSSDMELQADGGRKEDDVQQVWWTAALRRCVSALRLRVGAAVVAVRHARFRGETCSVCPEQVTLVRGGVRIANPWPEGTGITVTNQVGETWKAAVYNCVHGLTYDTAAVWLGAGMTSNLSLRRMSDGVELFNMWSVMKQHRVSARNFKPEDDLGCVGSRYLVTYMEQPDEDHKAFAVYAFPDLVVPAATLVLPTGANYELLMSPAEDMAVTVRWDQVWAWFAHEGFQTRHVLPVPKEFFSRQLSGWHVTAAQELLWLDNLAREVCAWDHRRPEEGVRRFPFSALMWYEDPHLKCLSGAPVRLKCWSAADLAVVMK